MTAASRVIPLAITDHPQLNMCVPRVATGLAMVLVNLNRNADAQLAKDVRAVAGMQIAERIIDQCPFTSQADLRRRIKGVGPRLAAQFLFGRATKRGPQAGRVFRNGCDEYKGCARWCACRRVR